MTDYTGTTITLTQEVALDNDNNNNDKL